MLKKILHTIDTTGPGGAETVFIDIATRLPADKYQSLVVIRGKGWVYEELCRRGIKPILLDTKGSFNWRYLYGLCKLILTERVNLVQSHLLGANVYCALAGLLTRRPVVATFHGSVDIGLNERWKWFKFAIINYGARQIISVTDSLKDDLAKRTSLDSDKIQVISNGVDAALFRRPPSSNLRERFGWSADMTIIGSLGNIRPAKGYDILLRAAAILAQKNLPYRFVVAGQAKSTDELYAGLQALRHELGLEEIVKFLGFIEDPAYFLSGIDLFLSSSISEGLPLSAIQAMVAEKPVIATRCGGYVKLISDDRNGCLVDVGDPIALAKGIEYVAGDEKLQERFAENARKYAENTFGIGVMLEAYEKIYAKLLRN